MDINVLANLISTVGFPIAVCVYLLYSNEKMRQTLEENTKVIAELKTLMSVTLKDIKKGEI